METRALLRLIDLIDTLESRIAALERWQQNAIADRMRDRGVRS
jgi:hypothetical protein